MQLYQIFETLLYVIGMLNDYISIEDFVWYQCLPEFDVILHLQNDLRVMVSTLSLLLLLQDLKIRRKLIDEFSMSSNTYIDFPVQPIQIYVIFSALTSCIER